MQSSAGSGSDDRRTAMDGVHARDLTGSSRHFTACVLAEAVHAHISVRSRRLSSACRKRQRQQTT